MTTQTENKERREEIEKEITEKKERLDILESNSNEEEYDTMLNESFPVVKIGCCEFSSSRILGELDPTAYRCGINDYNDEELSTIQDEIKELEEEKTKLERF